MRSSLTARFAARLSVQPLKQYRPLRFSDGPSGFQMRNAPDGLSELQARRLIAPGAPVRALVGDAREVLGYFEAH